MSTIQFPENGLVLGPLPAPKGSEGLQVMRLDFLDGAVLEKALKHGGDLKIRFGKAMKIQYGDETTELEYRADISSHELYKSSDNQSNYLEFIGSVTHLLTVRKQEDEREAARAKLQQAYAAHNDLKASQSTIVLGSGRKGVKATSLKGQKTGNTPRSGPGTPLLNGTRSPMPGTSEPIPQADLDAIRIPVAHILAVASASEHSLATKTRAPDEYIIRTLAKIGKKSSGGKWSLQDEFYNELDVWDFPYIKEQHRSRAIQNAREAFTRQRLDKHATEWKMLLPPEERQKAEEREREEREKAKLAPTPKPPSVRSVNADERAQSPRILPAVERKTIEEKPVAIKKTAAKGNAITKILTGKKPPVKKPKGQIGRPPKAASTVGGAQKKTTAARAKPAQQKYKSAETIIDSDEEADAVEIPLTENRPPLSGPPVVRKSVSPPELLSQPTSMRRTASKSSSVTASDTDSSRPLIKKRAPPVSSVSVTAKSPSNKRPRTGDSPMDRPSPALSMQGSAKLPPKPVSSYYKEAPSIHGAPRSVSNSPPKPSPLGSSPPITASTSTGRLSTASSPALTPSFTGADSSTASQSPLDSVAARSKHSNGSHRPLSPHGRTSVTAKTSNQRKSLVVNGRPQHRPLTPSTPPEVRLDQQTLDLGRKFQEDYAKYYKMYLDCQRETDPERKNEKIRKVSKLHGELENLKARIARSCQESNLD